MVALLGSLCDLNLKKNNCLQYIDFTLVIVRTYDPFATFLIRDKLFFYPFI